MSSVEVSCLRIPELKGTESLSHTGQGQLAEELSMEHQMKLEDALHRLP
ncbi:rCG31922 [Rattus norvegicus]|uniref:RCG31922 n=1 Tax=Rattus norvegicus TaxID=10116 RepID=A6KUN6_RAT|nr:rCG31922 [Rattus norvegicus]